MSQDVALVTALLEGAGAEVHRHGNVLMVGDETVVVVVVVDVPVGEMLHDQEVSLASARGKAPGVRRGVLVTPGILSFGDVRRRELFDPDFLHVGLDGIPRMADAVAT